MEIHRYNTPSGKSEVYAGFSWKKVHELIDPAKTIIISDSNVAGIYANNFPECEQIILTPGESSKNLETVEEICRQLLKLEVDRSFLLLGIGGGVVCDVTGFVASVYMRGIKCGYVSSTLLAQVDASTGGKTGVNSSGYKNVIGTFSQPEFVICDTSLLKTLPDDEFRSGLSELVKHALIRDSKLFCFLEKEKNNINSQNETLLEELVSHSIEIKISIVEKDEKEAGLRRILNFGHTIGHAIESSEGKKHGFAVAEGMYFASLFSLEKGYIKRDEHSRITDFLTSVGLIDELPVINPSITDHILRDKKRESGILNLVVLKGIGNAVTEQHDIEEFIRWVRTHI